MSGAIATIKNGLTLKWCYFCGFYEWSKIENGRYVCVKCNNPIEDWVTKLIFRGGK